MNSNARKVEVVFTLVLSTLLLNSTLSLAQQKPEDLPGKRGAGSLLVDSGKYAESWDEASAVFKSAVTKEKWQAHCMACAIRWAS